MLLSFPMMLLLLPTFTGSLPEMVPATMTMAGVSPETADLRALKLVTVVIEPPCPPVVPPLVAAKPSEAGSLGSARLVRGTAVESCVKAARPKLTRLKNFIADGKNSKICRWVVLKLHEVKEQTTAVTWTEKRTSERKK